MKIGLNPPLSRVEEQLNIAQDMEPKRSGPILKTIKMIGSLIRVTHCIIIPPHLLIQGAKFVIR